MRCGNILLFVGLSHKQLSIRSLASACYQSMMFWTVCQYTPNVAPNMSHRFKWPDHPQLKFRPSVGHLHAGATKEVTVTFSSTAPSRLDAAEVKMQLSQITFKSSDRMVDWDDVLAAAAVAVAGGGRGSMAGGVTRSSMAGGGAARASVAGGKGTSMSGEKVGVEPPNEVVQKTQRDLVVKVGFGRQSGTTCSRTLAPDRCLLWFLQLGIVCAPPYMPLPMSGITGRPVG